jgi:exodeoxyribonuclease VII large subunit
MTRKPADKPDEAPAGQLSLEARFATRPAAAAPAFAPGPAPPAVTEPAAPVPPAPVSANVPAEPRIYRVSELMRATRLTLESRFADVRVEGEVSGLKRSGPGHLYFALKDAEASLDCVLFSREAARLKFTLEEGMAVRCRGRLTLYEARGKFQMSVVDVEPTGAGALALAFEQLKQRLGAEGLFDPGRKRRLPFLPRRVGVVTSASGAVIRDIVRVAQRRGRVPILLAATPVQGDGASLAIAAAIRRLEAIADVDVIIVARGGGSLEDLWAFNEEPVARAIVACRVPIISGVGHETDFTIADFVADVRAPTPSAAAALAVPVFEDLAAELAMLRRRGGRALAETARRARHELERARARLGDPRRLLDERRQRLDDQIERGRRVLARRLAAAHAELRGAETRLYRAHPHRRISEQRGSLAAMRHRLEAAVRPALARRRHAIEAACGKLEALSPVRVLERGFSLTQRADGRLVTSAGDLQPGERIHVRLREGSVDASVDSVDPKGGK